MELPPNLSVNPDRHRRAFGRDTRWVWLLSGPIVAIFLVAITFAGNAGPGFGLLVLIVAAPALLLMAPLIQFGLLRTASYRDNHAAAAGVSFVVVAAIVWLAAMTGRFDFW